MPFLPGHLTRNQFYSPDFVETPGEGLDDFTIRRSKSEDGVQSGHRPIPGGEAIFGPQKLGKLPGMAREQD